MLLIGRVTGQALYLLHQDSHSFLKIRASLVDTEEALLSFVDKDRGERSRLMRVEDVTEFQVGPHKVRLRLLGIVPRDGDGKLRASLGFDADRSVRIVRKEVYEREVRASAVRTESPQDAFSEGIL